MTDSMQFTKWVTLGFGALCLVAVATVLSAPHLYYMAAILLTLPGISYLLGWYTLRGLQFSRRPSPALFEGSRGDLEYEVANPTPLTRFFLSVREDLPDWIEPAHEEATLFNVAAGETLAVSKPVVFRKRGVYVSHGFNVCALDPLGVFGFVRHVQSEAETVVYPLPAGCGASPLTGSESAGWHELVTSVLKGTSVDPDGVRPYVPGDALKRVHWRQTARTGTLNVVEFAESQSVHVAVALDTEAGTEVGTGPETTLEYAVRFAAELISEATRQGAATSLLSQWSAAAEGAVAPETIQAGRGQQHLYAVLDTLARVEAKSQEPVTALLDRTAGALPPRASVVVVTSKLSTTMEDAFLKQTALGASPILVYVDPEPFKSRPDQDAARFAHAVLGRLARSSAVFVLRKTGDRNGILEGLGIGA